MKRDRKHEVGGQKVRQVYRLVRVPSAEAFGASVRNFVQAGQQVSR